MKIKNFQGQNKFRPIKKSICVICERCNSKIIINTPNQIGQNIGRDRILCNGCYEWEMIPPNF